MRFMVRVASLCTAMLLSALVFAGPLKKTIEVPAFKGSISQYLDLIETHSSFVFSYNPRYLPIDSVIRKEAVSDKLGNILKSILPENIAFSESGDYVILKKGKTSKPRNKPVESSAPKEKKYVITGRVVNSLTGEVISEAVVYDHDRLVSTITDQQGYYSLTVSASNDFIPLSISKNSFFDTLIIVEPYEGETGEIDLKPIQPVLLEGPKLQRIEPHQDSNRVQNVGVVRLMVPQEAFAKTNSQGVQLSRPAQVSFLPMIGTNRSMGGLVENNFSLNLLAGYSGGVKGIEIGGLVNITRFDVEGLQLAGLGNITGGTVSGIQIGGFFNNNRGTIKGVQIAGFQNIVMDTVTGIQVAGFVNVLKGKMDGYQLAGFTNITTQDVTGMQLSGFINIARGNVDLVQASGFGNIGHDVGGGQISGFFNTAFGDVGGGQLTGFANVAKGSVKGWQAAGFSNVANGNVDGGQISGFSNVADSVNALQIAGFMNIAAGEIKGAQIAGFINIAQHVSGIQFAPFNFADSASGVPIGVFSFVKQGYHTFTYSASETFPALLSFRTGVDKFYNIFSIGQNPFSSSPYGALGIGFGSMKRFNDKWSRTWELESLQMRSDFSNRINYNSLYELRIKAGLHLGKAFLIQVGPHWAVHHRDVLEGNRPQLINPFGFKEYQLGDTEWVGWPGASLNLSLVF